MCAACKQPQVLDPAPRVTSRTHPESTDNRHPNPPNRTTLSSQSLRGWWSPAGRPGARWSAASWGSWRRAGGTTATRPVSGRSSLCGCS